MRKSVVVVGAGMAGISTARHLQNSGDYDVLVLEANQHRYGGRIWTFETPSHSPVELGAMWLHGGVSVDHPVANIFRIHNIPTIPHGYKVCSSAGYLSSGQTISQKDIETAEQSFFDVLKESLQYYAEKDRLDLPYLDCIKSVKPGWREKLELPVFKDILIPNIESLESASSANIPLRAFSGIFDFEFGNDMISPTGYNTVLKLLCEGEPDGSTTPLKVILGRQVEQIKLIETPKKSVEIICANGETYASDAVIIAVSLGVLKSGAIKFHPELPLAQQQAIARMGFGNYVKQLLIFDQMFWPEDTNIIMAASDISGLISLCINLYPINGLKALLTNTSGDGANECDCLTDEALKSLTLEAFKKHFGPDKVEKCRLLYYKRTKWAEDPFVCGAYSYDRLGMKEDDVTNVCQTVADRIFFGGEHTMYTEGSAATVHGAYLSGVKAAEAVKKCLNCQH